MGDHCYMQTVNSSYVIYSYVRNSNVAVGLLKAFLVSFCLVLLKNVKECDIVMTVFLYC